MTAKTSRHLPAWVLAVLSAVLAGGCAQGDLMVDLLATAETRSINYHLDPDGRLAVIPGEGMIEGLRDRPVYKTRLAEQAMEDFKRTVRRSGFLLQDSPTGRALTPGAILRLEVKLGLWHNVVQIHGVRMDSAARIIVSMNANAKPGTVLAT